VTIPDIALRLPSANAMHSSLNSPVQNPGQVTRYHAVTRGAGLATDPLTQVDDRASLAIEEALEVEAC
jgi:hypothetical protein